MFLVKFLSEFLQRKTAFLITVLLRQSKAFIFKLAN